MKKDDRKRPEGLTSILGGDTAFDGTLELQGSLRIDGSFQGSLTCGGSVTVGENGLFTGDIEADDLILGGKIQGRVVVHKLIVLEATSEFEGELTCTTLHVNEGAQFNGTSSMGKQAVEQKLLASKSAADVSDPDPFEPVDVPEEEQKTDNAFTFSPSEAESDSEIRDRLS